MLIHLEFCTQECDEQPPKGCDLQMDTSFQCTSRPL
jgi:hypothetical protein